MSKVLAWHFVGSDRRLVHQPDLLVEPGYIYSEPEGDIALCERGMHASIKPLDALQYAPGAVVCRVRCWGDVQHGEDKLVCRHREVLWMADAGWELRLFACWCVRQVWHLLTDERSRRAVEVAEAYAEGLATAKERDAASAAAAGAAARAAAQNARDAASAAAAGAAARAAAQNAAEAAARDAASAAAAGAAARAAARAAAWAAGAATWDAARAATWAAQNAELERRLLALEPK